MKKDQNLKLLFSIMLLSSILMGISILKQNFWVDEAITFSFASLPLKSLLLAVASDNNPPLYYILIHFLLKLTQSYYVLRISSLIFVILGTLFIYLLFKKETSPKIATTASALFALSPLTIYIGSEARLHSLSALMVILTTATFLSLRNKKSPKNILLFVITSSLGLYTQAYLFLLFIPFILLAVTQKRFKKILPVLALPLILFIPWFVITLTTPHNGCWCPNTILSLPASIVSPLVGGVGKFTLRNYFLLNWPQKILFALTIIFGLLHLAKGIKKEIIASFYFFPIFCLSLAGLFIPVFSPKGFSAFSPLFFLITARGLFSLKLGNSIIIMLLLLSTVSALQITTPLFLGNNLKKIALLTSSKNIPVANLSITTYYPLSHLNKNQSNILITKNPLNEKTVKYIGGPQQKIEKSINNLWLIDDQNWQPHDKETALKDIENSFSPEEKYLFGSVSVTYLTRNEKI